MERDRDKELQDLLQMAHQSGAPVFARPIEPASDPGYEVKIVVSKSGTEIKNADT
jgi:hypothetical protein